MTSELKPVLDCPCTTIQQDEHCLVGYPSLLCDVCGGKGVLPYVKLDGAELWEIVFGIATDAAREITDEQYSKIAKQINTVFIRPLNELRSSAVPDVPELVRYGIAYVHDDPTAPAKMEKYTEGDYVRHDQAADVIAAKDAELVSKLKEKDLQDRNVLEEISIDRWNWKERAEAAETKLIEWEKADRLVAKALWEDKVKVLEAKLAQIEKHATLLAEALGKCLFSAGIIRNDVSLTGPELLMFADDLHQMLSAHVANGADVRAAATTILDQDNTSAVYKVCEGRVRVYKFKGVLEALAALNPSEPRT